MQNNQSVAFFLGFLGAVLVMLGATHSHGQLYYNSPTPPTYHQYPGGTANPQYQQDVNNYLRQKDADQKQRDSDSEYQRTQKYRHSPEYNDPWGLKKKPRKPFDED